MWLTWQARPRIFDLEIDIPEGLYEEVLDVDEEVILPLNDKPDRWVATLTPCVTIRLYNYSMSRTDSQGYVRQLWILPKCWGVLNCCCQLHGGAHHFAICVGVCRLHLQSRCAYYPDCCKSFLNRRYPATAKPHIEPFRLCGKESNYQTFTL